MNPTLYDVLGVSRDASRDEIRQAWRQAADRFEPGEGGSPRQFRLFNEAAEVLLDPERRRSYDATLAADRPVPVPGPPIPGASSAATPEPPALGEDTSAPASSAADRPLPASGSVSGRLLTLLVVLGLLAAASVAAGAYQGSRGWAALQESKQAERHQEALDRAPAAAESAATAVLSYDYRSLEADRDAAARFLTDDYREKYVDTFDQLVVDSATRTKATVRAEVLASAAMVSGSRSDTRVPVLLFVDQTTSSTTNAGDPSVALNRVRLDMVEQDGTWLVDGITSY